MDKPIIIGMCILGISKVLIYSFLYDYLKSKLGQNVQVAYTDTDSFILEIKTPDVYADIRNKTTMFDTSDYSCTFGFKSREHVTNIETPNI